MKRDDLLRAIKYAGYHEDTKTGTRLYVENRISFQAYNDAWNQGRRMKQNGIPCGCSECSKPKRAAV
jgi:hypothetical protein